MTILKHIVIWLLQTRKIVKWYYQYFKCKRAGLHHRNLSKMCWSNIGNTLIIAPHSDDEWIGCYSVLSNINISDVFYCCYYGNDYSEANIAIRDKEIKDSANLNNYNLLNATMFNRYASLERVLSNGYDSVFIPAPFDWHPEHRAVFKMVFEILQKLKSKTVIYYYQISIPHRNYKTLYISGMSRVQQDNKWYIFEKIYKSQKMPVLRYKLQENLNAATTNFYSAEIFAKPSLEELNNDYLSTCTCEDKTLESYRLLVDNIFLIRNIALKQASYEFRK